MTGRITSTLVVLVFLLVAIAGTTGARTSNAQKDQPEEDTRKKPGFDPTQFPGEDLGPLLKDKKFPNGRHPLKTFEDGSKLIVETKQGKIRRAFLVDRKGSRSEATIHSPTGPPTARSFTIGVHIGGGSFERCYICTFGRDSQQQSGGAQTRARRKRCHSAPCDDFYPEPEPPPIDQLKKPANSNKAKP